MSGSLRGVIIEQLQDSGAWYEEVNGSNWIKCYCTNPEHNDHNPSAGINTDSGILHCFSCGYTEKFIKVNEDNADTIWRAKYANLKRDLKEYSDYDHYYETQKDRQKVLFLPPVSHYLDEQWRGVSVDVLQDCKAYYCDKGKYRGRYVFPFYQDGVQYGFDARIVDASANMVGAKWIRNRGAPVKDIVYPKDVLLKRFASVEHIVIAEGVMDALSYIQMGVPAIASFGLTPPSQRRIEDLIRMGVTKITIAFDNDEAGVAGTLKVLPAYSEWFEIVSHPMVEMVRNSGEKDANDFLCSVLDKGLRNIDDGEDIDL